MQTELDAYQIIQARHRRRRHHAGRGRAEPEADVLENPVLVLDDLLDGIG